MKKKQVKRYVLELEVAFFSTSDREVSAFFGSIMEQIKQEWKKRQKVGVAYWNGIVTVDHDVLFERSKWDNRMSKLWEDSDFEDDAVARFEEERSKVR